MTVHHPTADEFLARDCDNVANFFRRQGVETNAEELCSFVTREAEGDDAT